MPGPPGIPLRSSGLPRIALSGPENSATMHGESRREDRHRAKTGQRRSSLEAERVSDGIYSFSRECESHGKAGKYNVRIQAHCRVIGGRLTHSSRGIYSSSRRRNRTCPARAAVTMARVVSGSRFHRPKLRPRVQAIRDHAVFSCHVWRTSIHARQQHLSLCSYRTQVLPPMLAFFSGVASPAHTAVRFERLLYIYMSPSY